jgi:hypothetical protein
MDATLSHPSIPDARFGAKNARFDRETMAYREPGTPRHDPPPRRSMDRNTKRHVFFGGAARGTFWFGAIFVPPIGMLMLPWLVWVGLRDLRLARTGVIGKAALRAAKNTNDVRVRVRYELRVPGVPQREIRAALRHTHETPPDTADVLYDVVHPESVVLISALGGTPTVTETKVASDERMHRSDASFGLFVFVVLVVGWVWALGAAVLAVGSLVG